MNIHLKYFFNYLINKDKLFVKSSIICNERLKKLDKLINIYIYI